MVVNGWKGSRLAFTRLAALRRKAASNTALCATRTPRWQPCALIWLRTSLKKRLMASVSLMAPRWGSLRSMPVRRRESGLISASAKGRTGQRWRASMTRTPSSKRKVRAAISSTPWRTGSKPLVSRSTTTGKKPRNRFAMLAMPLPAKASPVSLDGMTLPPFVALLRRQYSTLTEDIGRAPSGGLASASTLGAFRAAHSSA